MEDNILGREKFITLKIINPIYLLTKRITNKYTTIGSLIKFLCVGDMYHSKDIQRFANDYMLEAYCGEVGMVICGKGEV